MFGGKKTGPEMPPLATGPGGDPWDQETIDWLASTKQLDLRVSYIERRFKSGPAAPRRGGEVINPEVIATGFLPHAAQHVHVQIEFHDRLEGFGEGFLTYYHEQDHPAAKINLPYIDIRIRDPEAEMQRSLVEALRDSIAAGQSVAEARCWIKPSDNWAQSLGGHGRWFHIEGMLVWALLRSPRLSNWALPIGMAEFAEYPSLRQLRRAPKPER